MYFPFPIVLWNSISGHVTIYQEQTTVQKEGFHNAIQNSDVMYSTVTIVII